MLHDGERLPRCFHCVVFHHLNTKLACLPRGEILAEDGGGKMLRKVHTSDGKNSK